MSPKPPIQALGRQALHAAELGFEHPVTGEEMFFEAPLPPDLQALEDALEALRQGLCALDGVPIVRPCNRTAERAFAGA